MCPKHLPLTVARPVFRSYTCLFSNSFSVEDSVVTVNLDHEPRNVQLVLSTHERDIDFIRDQFRVKSVVVVNPTSRHQTPSRVVL